MRGNFQSRPFAAPEPLREDKAPDLETERDRATRFGHNFGEINVSPDLPPIIQPKLTLGPMGDKYEQEADRVATAVVDRLPAPTSPSEGQDPTVQRPPAIQRLPVAASTTPVSPPMEAGIQQARGGGQRLSENLRQPMEQAFGADFSGVRVHADAGSDALNRSIEAKAFTTGQDVFLRQGAYDPGSQGGRELIAHELTHVVQQHNHATHVIQRVPGTGTTLTYNYEPPSTKEEDEKNETTTEETVKGKEKIDKIGSIKQLQGGAKGKVFVLEYESGKKKVIKFQAEDPSEAIIGTKMMEAAEVKTPELERATVEKLQKIVEGFSEDVPNQTAQNAFEEARQKFPRALIMDFAPGQTIKEMMDKTPDKLIRALLNTKFQESFGRMLAADAFSGNTDRAAARQDPNKPEEISGWYNEGNVMISEGEEEFEAVAIDNEYDPSLSPRAPYGTGNQFKSYGSLMAANEKLFRVEAGLLVDRILKEMENLSSDPEVMAGVAEVRKKRSDFIKGMTTGAEEAMGRLLRRRTGWKGIVKEQESGETYSEFRMRKRYIRLVRYGYQSDEAMKIAKDNREYGEWKKYKGAFPPPARAKQKSIPLSQRIIPLRLLKLLP